jgi:hypothetical protein
MIEEEPISEAECNRIVRDRFIWAIGELADTDSFRTKANSGTPGISIDRLYDAISDMPCFDTREETHEKVGLYLRTAEEADAVYDLIEALDFVVAKYGWPDLDPKSGELIGQVPESVVLNSPEWPSLGPIAQRAYDLLTAPD